MSIIIESLLDEYGNCNDIEINVNSIAELKEAIKYHVRDFIASHFSKDDIIEYFEDIHIGSNSDDDKVLIQLYEFNVTEYIDNLI